MSMEALNIYRVCEQFPPGVGGLASGMFDITSAQQALGHEVTVVTQSCFGDQEFDAQQPFKVIRVGAKRIFQFAWKAFDIIKNLDVNPDLIHLHGPASAVFLMRRSADFPPLIQTMHAVRKYQLGLFRDMPTMMKAVEARTGVRSINRPEYDRRFLFRVLKDLYLESYICRRLDHIAVVAEYFAKQVSKYYGVPDRRITITYNGSKFDASQIIKSDTRYLDEAGIGEGKKIILYVGRVDWVKRVHLIVEAMPDILREFPDCRLLIVGDGDQRQYLNDIIEKLSLKEEVRLLGWVEHSYLPELFKVASCFCLPSYWEGLSKAAIEAMSAQIPVILSDNLSHRELLREGKYGWLVSGVDPGPWTQAIKMVLRCGIEVEAKVKEAASLVDSMFRWNLVAERLNGAYKTMLEDWHRTRRIQ